MWDNLFRIVLLNLGFLAVFAILVYIPFLFRSVPALLYLSMILGLAILFVYTGLASRMAREIADYRGAELRELGRYLRDSWPSSLLFFAVNAVFFFLLSIAFPVYGRMQSLVGPIAASLLFWITLVWILSCLFFYPVQSRLDRNIRKILRKMLLLFLDNPLFSIGLLLGSLFIFAVSLFTAFLLPGPGTLLLWLNAGLKLRLYKYDYLERNPQADRRRIPWDALLVEDRERVGKRTLKGMIFPWKE